MRTQRNYSKNFKEEALKLVSETSIRQAASELGIPENTLRYWSRAAKARPDNPFIGSGKKYISPDEMEKMELRKENRELKRANEILKEAMSFFTQSRRK